MDADLVLFLTRRTLETALLLSAPVLVVVLVMGAAVALFQTVTSIKDMTMGLVLKLVGVGVTILMTGGWSLQVAVDFTREIFNQMQMLGH
ncbi:MAG: flagellar biosynthetic protein FliQ [Planctomycetota bacterium]|jgi:flagellar biosynthetic protein FliQ|nr:flagellar biosynthetic protein FliQ [Planctomycetota bacterium]